MSSYVFSYYVISVCLLLLQTLVVLADLQPYTFQCVNGQCENGHCVNETCLCDPGWTGSQCQFCNGRFRLTAETGTIHDGAGNYSLSSRCTWLIDTPSRRPIKLKFHQFSTECSWDHLHVFDGLSVYSPLVGSFSGISQGVKDVTLHSGTGFLYFVSDVAYSMAGFNITYRVVKCPADCSNHGNCDLDMKTCNCTDGWSGEACDVRPMCPSQCSANGTCVNGTCVCAPNYTGDDCSIFTATSTSWMTVPTESAPVGRASFGADLLGDYLYIYGGETLLNRFTVHNNDSAAFFRYHVPTRTWSTLDSDWSGEQRFGHSLSSSEDEQKLYLYGGTVDGRSSSDLASFDTLSRVWQVLPPGRIAVSGHSAHAVDDKLYVFFGQSGFHGFHPLLQVYDIANSSWSILATDGVTVRGRYGHSSVYDPFTNSVFVFGGYRESRNAGSYSLSRTLYKFDVNASTWVGLMPSRHRMYLHSAVLMTEGLMLVSGGNPHNDTAASSGAMCYSTTLLAYDLCCDRWLEMEAADWSNANMARFGHTMYNYNGSVHLYGGFNGVMLGDTLRLNTPDCSLLNSSVACALNSTHGLCTWIEGEGCSMSTREDVCNAGSCSRTDAEMKAKCNQFVDCVSCLSSPGCYYKAGPGADYCGIELPHFSMSPALQDMGHCPSLVCSKYRNCRLCESADTCSWSATGKRWSSCEIGTHLLGDGKEVCDAPCHTHTSCGNCTSSKCLWCESQSQCIDSNSYLSYFPYGQCLEWTTASPKCAEVACADIRTCADCHKNPMCGWCNDPSNTGLGVCSKGGMAGDLNSTCPATDWYFTSCPLCQCNGHSQCDSLNRCESCGRNTTGEHCEVCNSGHYGNAANGGLCQDCQCSEVADACDNKTGACQCRVQGAVSPLCDSCDNTRHYYKDTIFNAQCYYKIGVDYRYTFNYSKIEDKHVTAVNLQCNPKYTDRDMEMTIVCHGPANLNLTMYSLSYPGKYQRFHQRVVRCASRSTVITIDSDDYQLDARKYNATVLLRVTDFTTPFVFQISFTQHPRINLFKFFLIFFGCFLGVMLIAGFAWKLRAKYLLVLRQTQEREERRNMASRPFASIFLPVEDLKGFYQHDEGSGQAKSSHPSRQSAAGGEPLSAFQRTFSKRFRQKHSLSTHNTVTAVGLEALEGQRSAGVVSVLVKLPTGCEDVAGQGCSGLAFGSALVAIPPNSMGNITTKVIYRQGKVTFKSPSIFSPA